MTFLFIDRLRDVRKGNDVFINSLFLLLILNMTLSEFRTISMRISGLFAFSYWIIWPDLIQCFRYRGNKVLYVIFLFAYSILKVSTTGSMLKYENVLFPHMNYNERLIYFSRHFYDDK